MDLNLFISIIFLGIAIATFIITLWLNRRRNKLANYSLSLTILKDMIKEFRSPKFREHRNFITSEKLKQCPTNLGFSNLPPDAKKHVLTVSHFLDHLGCVLVANKYMDDKYIISFIGESIKHLWDILKPYINHERKKRRNPYYQGYFQELVYRIGEEDLVKLRKSHFHEFDSMM